MAINSKAWTTWSDADWLQADPNDSPNTYGDRAAWRRRVAHEQRVRGDSTSRLGLQLDEARSARPAPGGITSEDVPAAVAAEIIAQARMQRKARRKAEKAREKTPEARRLAATIRATVDGQIEARERDADLWRTRARQGVGPITPAPAPALRFSTLNVKGESLVYGPGSSFSWFVDVASLAAQTQGSAIPSSVLGQRYGEVAERLVRSDHQIAHLAASTERYRVAYMALHRERNRPFHGTASDRSFEDFRNFVHRSFESRAVSTVSGSMGDFAPPLYVLETWCAFLTAAASLASQARQEETPATGMTIDRPYLGSKVSMAVQASENSAVATSSPSAGYVSTPVKTIAGAVKVSQQYLDRVGPGIDADRIILEEAARTAATALDVLALTTVISGLATSHKVTNANAPSFADFYADLARYSALITTVDGTRLPVTHVFAPTANIKWWQAQLDSSSRPLWLPTAAGDGARPGAVGTPLEGYSGYDIQGAQVFYDDNLATFTTSTHASVLIGNAGRGLCVYQSSSPIVNTWPEFSPTALEAIINIRSYVGVALLYPAAWVRLTGAQYAKTPTFTGS